MLNAILSFFDRLEDVVRGFLSRRPIIYAVIAGTGVTLFWRGVWYIADYISQATFSLLSGNTLGIETTIVWWDGPLSMIIGTLLLLISGAFVSTFIGNELILSGIKGEKKLFEKTEVELRENQGDIKEINLKIDTLTIEIENLEKMMKK